MRKVCVSLSMVLCVLVFLRGFCSAEEKLTMATAQALYEQGYQLVMQAKWKEAIEYFDRALSLDSTHLLAWCDKGAALNKLERWSEAISAFDSALKLDRDCIFALVGKAVALEELDRKTEAKRF